MINRLSKLVILCLAILAINSACLSIKAPERIDLGGRNRDRSDRRDRDDRDDRHDHDRDRDDDDRYDDDDDD